MLYARPILIYDNCCSSCTWFAKTSRILSCRRIYTVGHYTVEGRQIKDKIFPKGLDAESMFWIVTVSGAFGGRSGLLPVAREVLKGLLGMGEKVSLARGDMCENEQEVCSAGNVNCSTTQGFFSRISGLLRNGKKIDRADLRSDTLAT